MRVEYKLIYSSADTKGRGGVEVILDKQLRESVLEVNGVPQRLMTVKLYIRNSVINIISTCAQ